MVSRNRGATASSSNTAGKDASTPRSARSAEKDAPSPRSVRSGKTLLKSVLNKTSGNRSQNASLQDISNRTDKSNLRSNDSKNSPHDLSSSLDTTGKKRGAALAAFRAFQEQETPRTTMQNFIDVHEESAMTPAAFFSKNTRPSEGGSYVKSASVINASELISDSSNADQHGLSAADISSDVSSLDAGPRNRRGERKRKAGVTAEEMDPGKDITQPLNKSNKTLDITDQLSDTSSLDETARPTRNKRRNKKKFEPSDFDFSIPLPPPEGKNKSRPSNKSRLEGNTKLDMSDITDMSLDETPVKKMRQRKQSRRTKVAHISAADFSVAVPGEEEEAALDEEEAKEELEEEDAPDVREQTREKTMSIDSSLDESVDARAKMRHRKQSRRKKAVQINASEFSVAGPEEEEEDENIKEAGEVNSKGEKSKNMTKTEKSKIDDSTFTDLSQLETPVQRKPRIRRRRQTEIVEADFSGLSPPISTSVIHPEPVVNALSDLADIEKVGEAIKERGAENISQAEIREMLNSPEKGARRRAGPRTDKVTDWDSAFHDIPGPEKTQGGDIPQSKTADRMVASPTDEFQTNEELQSATIPQENKMNQQEISPAAQVLSPGQNFSLELSDSPPLQQLQKSHRLHAIESASAAEIISNEGIDFDEISRLAANTVEPGLEVDQLAGVDVTNRISYDMSVVNNRTSEVTNRTAGNATNRSTRTVGNVTNMDVVTMSPATIRSPTSIMSPGSPRSPSGSSPRSMMTSQPMSMMTLGTEMSLGTRLSPYRDLEDSDSLVSGPIPRSKRRKVQVDVDEFNMEEEEDDYENQFKKFLNQDAPQQEEIDTNEMVQNDEPNNLVDNEELSEKFANFEELKARRAARKSEVLGHLVRAPNLSNIHEESENPSSRFSTETNGRLSTETCHRLSAGGRLSTEYVRSRTGTPLSPTKEVNESACSVAQEENTDQGTPVEASEETPVNEAHQVSREDKSRSNGGAENEMTRVQSEEASNHSAKGTEEGCVQTDGPEKSAIQSNLDKSTQNGQIQENLEQNKTHNSVNEINEKNTTQNSVQKNLDPKLRRKSVYQAGLPENQQNLCDDTMYEPGYFIPNVESTRLGNMTGLVDLSPISTSVPTHRRQASVQAEEEEEGAPDNGVEDVDGANAVEDGEGVNGVLEVEAKDQTDGITSNNGDITKSSPRKSSTAKIVSSTVISEKVLASKSFPEKVSPIHGNSTLPSSSSNAQQGRNSTLPSSSDNAQNGRNSTLPSSSNNAQHGRDSPLPSTSSNAEETKNSTLPPSSNNSQATKNATLPSTLTASNASRTEAGNNTVAASNSDQSKCTAGVGEASFAPIVNTPSPRSRSKYEPTVASPLIRSNRSKLVSTLDLEKSNIQQQNKTNQSSKKSDQTRSALSSKNQSAHGNSETSKTQLWENEDHSHNLSERQQELAVQDDENVARRASVATQDYGAGERHTSVATQDYEDASSQCYETPEYLREIRRSIKNKSMSLKQSLYLSKLTEDDIAEGATQTTPSVTLERLSLDKIERIRRSVMSETACQVTPSLAANPGLSKTLGHISRQVNNREHKMSKSIAACGTDEDEGEGKDEGTEVTEAAQSNHSETIEGRDEGIEAVEAAESNRSETIKESEGRDEGNEVVEGAESNHSETIEESGGSEGSEAIGVQPRLSASFSKNNDDQWDESERVLNYIATQEPNARSSFMEVSSNKTSPTVAEMLPSRRVEASVRSSFMEDSSNKSSEMLPSRRAATNKDNIVSSASMMVDKNSSRVSEGDFEGMNSNAESEVDMEVIMGKSELGQNQVTLDTTEEQSSANEADSESGDGDKEEELDNTNPREKIDTLREDWREDSGEDIGDNVNQNKEEISFRNEVEGDDNQNDDDEIWRKDRLEQSEKNVLEAIKDVSFHQECAVMDDEGRESHEEVSQSQDRANVGEVNVDIPEDSDVGERVLEDKSNVEEEQFEDDTGEVPTEDDTGERPTEEYEAEQVGEKEKPQKQDKVQRQATLDRYLGVQDRTADVGISQLVTPSTSKEAAKPMKVPVKKKPAPAPKTTFPKKNIIFDFQRFSRYKVKKDAEETLCNASQDFMDMALARLEEIVQKRGASKIHLCDIKQVMVECGFIPKDDDRNLHLYDTLRKTVRQDAWMELIPRAVGDGSVYPPLGCWEDTGVDKKRKRKSQSSGSSQDDEPRSRKKKTSASNVRRFKVPRPAQNTDTNKQISKGKKPKDSKVVDQIKESKNGGRGRKGRK